LVRARLCGVSGFQIGFYEILGVLEYDIEWLALGSLRFRRKVVPPSSGAICWTPSTLETEGFYFARYGVGISPGSQAIMTEVLRKISQSLQANTSMLLSFVCQHCFLPNPLTIHY
jgi:hypothetical protein